MTNTQLLQQVIDNAGIKIGKILEATGIRSYATLRAKINNEREFTANEIMSMCELLRIEKDKRDAIFFASDAELYSA